MRKAVGIGKLSISMLKERTNPTRKGAHRLRAAIPRSMGEVVNRKWFASLSSRENSGRECNSVNERDLNLLNSYIISE